MRAVVKRQGLDPVELPHGNGGLQRGGGSSGGRASLAFGMEGSTPIPAAAGQPGWG